MNGANERRRRYVRFVVEHRLESDFFFTSFLVPAPASLEGLRQSRKEIHIVSQLDGTLISLLLALSPPFQVREIIEMKERGRETSS